MSTTTTTSRAQQITSTSTRRTPVPASLRLDTALPTTLSFSLEAQFTLVELDTTSSTLSATPAKFTFDPSTTNPADESSASCSVDTDCTTGKICAEGRCANANEAAPLGGSGGEPTSHLSTSSAIGISVGVVGFIAILIGLGFWFRRSRGRQPPKPSIEAPRTTNRDRSASNGTGWTVDNDQKTLVASLPNSPQNAAFREQNGMTPEFFAKAAALNSPDKEKAEFRSSIAAADQASVRHEKTLPPRPSTENPLPPPPVERPSYALNVNINKSMIFDEEMITAMSPLRYSGTPRSSGTPRERTPRYRFEEYLPPVATPPAISIIPAPSSKRNSEYELQNYPDTKNLWGTQSNSDEASDDETSSQDPREMTLSKLESKPPLLPLPDLPPPSPSFSFRSYDWYQDIIEDPTSETPLTPTLPDQYPALTPTRPKSPAPLSLFPKIPDSNSSLIPEPLSPAATSKLARGGPSAIPPAPLSSLSALHSNPVPQQPLSPTNPDYTLSPAVYQMPSRKPIGPQVPPMPPQPPSPPLKSTRVSALSTMTRKTHNSRSWLPEEGLYLPEEGTMDSWKKLRRPRNESRPTSYSPLT
ncbi:hypothetical protein IQ07DRAFT_135937 [Pyrenochaeta sp. DS3sAY3a]|nr:hypothetical protein IQ07DRAFT_135937 [Pyrenochaeta sp. DS3sAY3a]